MENRIRHLENFDIYNTFCSLKLGECAKKNPSKVYHKHDFLFMEDDLCREIILIGKGKVKIAQYDKKGSEKVIAFLGKGEILGHLALLGEPRHRTFAEVMQDGTQVFKMDIRKARELTRDFVPFAQAMNRRISGHVLKLERRIEILLCKSIKLRLVKFLKGLAEDRGRPRNGGIWISYSLTQSEIAALLGTTRKSASLMLNELAHNGLIEFDRKHIFIFNPYQLNRMMVQQETLYTPVHAST